MSADAYRGEVSDGTLPSSVYRISVSGTDSSAVSYTHLTLPTILRV